MMKRSQWKNKQNNTFRNTAAIVGVLGGALLLLHFFAPTILSDTFNSIASPVWSARQSLLANASLNTQALFSDERELAQENQRLREKVRNLKAKLANKIVIEKENEQLQKMLERQASERNMITARVLAHPAMSPYDTLIVDVGKKSGVEAGSLVRRGGIALGEVVSVSETTARIKLFSSPGVKTEVTLSGSESPQTTATGRGGGNIRITLPRGVSVKEGDNIIPASYPQFTLGSVQQIEKAPADSFQTIHSRLPINIYEIKYVSITRNSSE